MARRRRKKRAYIPSSKNEHWNTTPEDVAMVRQAFGGPITTDPCSNATSLVGAQIRYAKHDNGLAQPWWGHVFINPPYGKVILLWLAWGLLMLRVGCARRLIYLIPARTDTRWFFAYVLQASSICFCSGRRKFVGAKDQAPFPVMFVHFGPEADLFEQAFAGQGEFWRPNRKARLAAAARATTLRPMSEKPKASEDGPDMEAVQGAIAMIVQAGLHKKIYEGIKHMTVGEVVELGEGLLHQHAEGYFTRSVKQIFGIEGSVGDLRSLVAERQKAAPGKKKAAKKKAKKAGKKAAKKKAAKKKASTQPAPRAKKKAPRNHPKKKVAKKKATKKAAAPAAGGSKTAQLDDKVLKTLSGLKKPDGARITDVMPKLNGFSDQQVRRSLQRLTGSGAVEKRGTTKNTVYLVAA